MRIHSHSSLGSFENCPRQYWYQYIGKPPVERVDTIEAFLGTCVHETLEALYQLRLRGRVLSHEETLEGFETVWAKGWSDTIRIVSEELKAEDYKQAGREALTSYYRRYAPFDQATTLRLEAKVIFDLDPRWSLPRTPIRGGDDDPHPTLSRKRERERGERGDSRRYRMQGYVDRIARRGDGTYEIHDYKTSSGLPTQAEADEDRQLALYQIGLEGMWNDVAAVDLIWHYVRFDTDLVSHRTPEQLQGVRKDCITVIDDIESRGREEEKFPTNPSSLCPWCDFRTICPATRHEYATAALPPKEFKADDGVQLVDRWAETVEKRKELEAEAAELRELEEELQGLVEEFAMKEGLEAVVGSAYRAEIVKTSGVEFPRTGSELREAFEAVLKETGLWDRVAAPLHAKLASLLNNPDELPPEARKLLERFLEPFERIQAKLKKKKEEE
jgi:RecB family exonuclease